MSSILVIMTVKLVVVRLILGIFWADRLRISVVLVDRDQVAKEFLRQMGCKSSKGPFRAQGTGERVMKAVGRPVAEHELIERSLTQIGKETFRLATEGLP
jgi:hypothetical protein